MKETTIDNNIVYGGVGIFLAVMFVAWWATRPPLQAAPPRSNYSAQIAQAQEFVRANLKSPASASFPWLDYKVYDMGGDKWAVSSYVDAQNGFGANIRNHWTVVMQNGKLLNLEWSNQ